MARFRPVQFRLAGPGSVDMGRAEYRRPAARSRRGSWRVRRVRPAPRIHLEPTPTSVDPAALGLSSGFAGNLRNFHQWLTPPARPPSSLRKGRVAGRSGGHLTARRHSSEERLAVVPGPASTPSPRSYDPIAAASR
jgi:hypothetical protein